jgi:hypothetical protein
MKSIHGDSYLDYPDARDSGELVGEDGRLPRVLAGGAASAAAQALEREAECPILRRRQGARGRGRKGGVGEDEARGVGWEWVGRLDALLRERALRCLNKRQGKKLPQMAGPLSSESGCAASFTWPGYCRRPHAVVYLLVFFCVEPVAIGGQTDYASS